MRTRYIVTYDISEDERRSRVFSILRGYGDHLQYSVFRCDLSDREHVSLIAAVHAQIDHGSDQILMVNLGPVEGRGADCIESIGRKYLPPERTVVVI